MDKKQNRQTRLWRYVACMIMMLFATSAYSAPKNIVVLGDSLSAEYGLTRGTGWVALLEKRLAEQKIDATIMNASISGETTSGGKARLASLLARHKPDIVIIELGANDALRGLQLSATKANLQDMIKSVQDTKAKVLLVGMQIPPNYGRDYTQQFAAMFGALAKTNKTAFVPFLLDKVADKMDLFQSDRIHPNEQAHPTILNNVWPHLKPLL